MWHTNEISWQYTNNPRGRYGSVAENLATDAAEASRYEGDENRYCDPKTFFECLYNKDQQMTYSKTLA